MNAPSSATDRTNEFKPVFLRRLPVETWDRIELAAKAARIDVTNKSAVLLWALTSFAGSLDSPAPASSN